MAPVTPGGPRHPAVGAVVEQRRGTRDVLVFHETAERSTVIESIDDIVSLSERLVGRIKSDLDDLNAGLDAADAKLDMAMRATRARIDENQENLDRLSARVG